MAAYILAVDLGTSSVRAVLFTKSGDIHKVVQCQYAVDRPQSDYAEQDAMALWDSTCQVVSCVCFLVFFHVYGQCHQVIDEVTIECAPGSIAAVGITNQRESVVCWDKSTGLPLSKAINWSDARTESLCHELKQAGHESWVKERSGLPLSTYFSGVFRRLVSVGSPVSLTTL
jgi:glycerol kinase